MKELKHQTGKKNDRPLRKLLNNFADKGLVEILPVWLASPEMVSSIFPLNEGLFDIVIFDEASQLTVESGMPSIYRGKQIIVAGDEKQLPPSIYSERDMLMKKMRKKLILILTNLLAYST